MEIINGYHFSLRPYSFQKDVRRLAKTVHDCLLGRLTTTKKSEDVMKTV